MLPERVSSGLCTLAEGEDRLAYTVRYAVSVRTARSAGSRRGRRSSVRGGGAPTSEVFGWLETDRPGVAGGDRGTSRDSLELLAEAANRLGKARRRRGSLDFELAEPEIAARPGGHG